MRETLRRKFSALLMHTSEDNPMKCSIKIGEKEAMGLSSLELPEVVKIFQHPIEGIIYFLIDGMEDYMEFDDLDIEDLEVIYNNIALWSSGSLSGS